MPNYVDVLARFHPEAEVYLTEGKDSTVYADLTWMSTPIPQATLDADAASLNTLDYGLNQIQLITGAIPRMSGTSKILSNSTTSPAITDGTEVFKNNITPSSSDSIIEVSFHIGLDIDLPGGVSLAVFRDNVCIWAGWEIISADENIKHDNKVKRVRARQIYIPIVDKPGAVQNYTYSLRVGRAGSLGTWHINLECDAEITDQMFNGLTTSRYFIREYR